MSNDNALVDFVWPRVTEELLIYVSGDVTGNRSHIIGINMLNRKVHDCIEVPELPSTFKGLIQCCGKKFSF